MTMHETRPPATQEADPRARGARCWLQRHALLSYTIAAYAISWTLLIGGFVLTDRHLVDDDSALILIVGQVAAAGPLIAALALVPLVGGRRGLSSFARSLVRWRVGAWWYALAFLGIPATMIAAASALRPGSFGPALAENWPTALTQFPVAVLFLMVFTGLPEEPGWRGFAQPEADRRYRPLVAALVVSLVWAGWHLPNLLFGQSASETALHLLATTVNGFVLAWVYNATRGSVFIVILLHAAQNATAGLVIRVSQESAEAISKSEYYAMSAMVFGIVVLTVALATSGRLGLASTRGTNAA